MAEARLVGSIHDIGRDRWNACFPDALEDFDYLAAVEAAGLPGFEWRYVVAEAHGRLAAAAPAFLTDYSLDTTLTPAGRRMVAGLRRVSPRALTLRLACLGSPCTEDVGLGFSPDVSLADRAPIVDAMLAAFEADAAAAGAWLLGVKDAPEPDALLWAGAARRGGYQATPGLPCAELDIDFPDIEAYLGRLSRATRRDMRRKLRSLDALRIEVRSDLAGFEDRTLDLYRQTRARSDLQFEDLPAAYFTGVLAGLPGRALCVLYFEGSDLIGVNLLIASRDTLLDKFFCMDTTRGPARDLWFVSWFTNVRLCLERGLSHYRSGQAGYADKLRLGSRIVDARMYFRHRRPLVNRALRWAAPLLADDPLPARSGA